MSKEIELKGQALTLKDQVQALTVTDAASYEAAGEMLKVIKQMDNTIVAHFKPLKQAIDASKKVVLDQEKAALGPVQEADGILRKTVREYLDAEDKRIQEEADRQRIANEAAAENEREKLLKQAAKADEKGNTKKAEELLEKAEDVYVAPVTVEHSVDKTVSGITRKMETTVTVTDATAFLKALVEQSKALTMIEIKPGPLKTWVKANDLKRFPGLLIEEKAGISVRA